MVDQQRQQADRLLALSEAMLECAGAGDWPGLEPLQGERDRLARSLFAAPVPAALAEHVAARVQRVLEIDRELIASVGRGRDRAGDEVRELTRGRAGAAAYQRFSD